MDIDRTINVSPTLSAQRTASDHATAVVKLANQQIEAQGAAILELVQSIPQADGRIGTNINVRV